MGNCKNTTKVNLGKQKNENENELPISVLTEERHKKATYEDILNTIDFTEVEEGLKKLVIEIEKTNARLEKSKVITYDTLKLVVSL